MSTAARRTRGAATVAGLAVAAGAALSATPFTPAAHAADVTGAYRPRVSAFDNRLLADINRTRAAHGLRRLVLTAGTTDVAHSWTCHLAAIHGLAHNGALPSQLESHGSYRWTTYGENVGDVKSTAGADRLFRSYMRSPEHRANILASSSRFVGIWSKRSGAFRFNTIDFVGSTSTAYSTGYGGQRQSC